MGLDIGLNRYDTSKKEVDKLIAKFEKESDKIWENVYKGRKYEELSEEEKKTTRKKVKEVAKKLGFTNEWGAHWDVHTVEMNSELYPEHMFKIGYFRSSYNDGGINRVLKRVGVQGLYEIFPHFDDDEFRPDWKYSLVVVKNIIKQYEKYLKTEISEYNIIHVSKNCFNDDSSLPQSEQQALTIFEKELESHKKYKTDEAMGDGYSSKEGLFYLNGLKIRAVIPGIENILGKQPCSYVVIKPEYDKTDSRYWYLHALEIVKETIEWVLTQADIDKYYLSWSS